MACARVVYKRGSVAVMERTPGSPVAVMCAAVLGIVSLQVLHLDQQLADWLYAWQGASWRWRHAPWLSHVMHTRGQQAAQLVYVCVLVVALVSWQTRWLADWRRRLTYAALAMTLCYAIVGGSKALLPVPCPWDLARYGGHLPDGSFLHWQAQATAVKGCFPSGHAAGGYVLFALYFAAAGFDDRMARAWLACALVVGITFGIAQQLRGAHFLSHDVATAAVCWSVCAMLKRLLPGGEQSCP